MGSVMKPIFQSSLCLLLISVTAVR
jgi:hypothetical protein